MIQDILDGHAPIKHKRLKYPVLFMNSKLRKACLQKAMLRNKYLKQGRSGPLWGRYRKVRNHVTKLKAVSMNTTLICFEIIHQIIGKQSSKF